MNGFVGITAWWLIWLVGEEMKFGLGWNSTSTTKIWTWVKFLSSRLSLELRSNCFWWLSGIGDVAGHRSSLAEFRADCCSDRELPVMRDCRSPRAVAWSSFDLSLERSAVSCPLLRLVVSQADCRVDRGWSNRST